MIRDVAHHAAPGLDDPPLGNAEEAHVEIVQIELFDSPATLRDRLVQVLLVSLHQIALFFRADAGKRVVGRIAQNHQNGLALLDFVGLVAFLLKFREWNRHLPASLRQWFPVGERVGQIDAHPFPILSQRYAELPQQQAQL